MKKITIFLITIQTIVNNAIAQKDSPEIFSHSQDSVGEIGIYNKYIDILGSDSVKYTIDGLAMHGWHEEHYSNGKLLHRGYYKKGKLILFKNYFENGFCERRLTTIDPLNSILDIFYANGNLKKQIIYYNGLQKKVAEFFDNGIPKSLIENEKEMKYLKYSKVWFMNGQLKYNLSLLDVNTQKYFEKTYYSDGHLKSEGYLLFLKETNSYEKTGSWNL